MLLMSMNARRRDDPSSEGICIRHSASIAELCPAGSLSRKQAHGEQYQSILLPYQSMLTLCGLRRLGEFRLNRFFVGDNLLRARPAADALKVRHAIREPGKVELELRRAAEAPEEVRVGGREMIEEEFAPSEEIVRDLEVLEQHVGGELAHTRPGV